jgi:hypothetical protein
MGHERNMPRALDGNFFVGAAIAGVVIEDRSNLVHHWLRRIHVCSRVAW